MAINEIIADAVSGDTVVIEPGDHYIDRTVVIDKPLTVMLRGAHITGPVTGYGFEITADDVSILGSGGSELVLSNGGAGGIEIAQSHRARIEGFAIELNNIANTTGIYHNGGWYTVVRDVTIPKATTAAGSIGVHIHSTNANLGTFIGNYENVTCQWLNIVGVAPMTVTTMTFTNLDCSRVTAILARALTFIQPVIQQNGGSHFVLENVDGVTVLGGDLEGSGTIYDFRGSCRGIKSIGNLYSGFTGDYYNEPAGPGSLFMDYDEKIIPSLEMNQTVLKLHNFGYEPPNMNDGALIYADGINWNPGGGPGFYGYDRGAWRKFHD